MIRTYVVNTVYQSTQYACKPMFGVPVGQQRMQKFCWGAAASLNSTEVQGKDKNMRPGGDPTNPTEFLTVEEDTVSPSRWVPA